MKLTRAKSSLLIVITVLAHGHLMAGTLENAPFRIVLPNDHWQLDDSAAQPMGAGMSLVATIVNTNAQLKSVVIRTPLGSISASSLDELCTGVRDSFKNPAVKLVSDEATTFLNLPARKFIYYVKQGDQSVYNSTILFVANNAGWTIACVGSPEQEDEVTQIISFYQKPPSKEDAPQ
jgi:hypothetical protein